MSNLHRICVAGATGRMGRMLIEAVCNADDCQLGGALELAGNAAMGQDPAAFLGRNSGVAITADMVAGLQNSQVLIDFTRPQGTLAHLRVCRQLGVKAVIGTTGFSDAEKAEIATIANDIAIVMAPNMTVGVNVTLKLLELAAQALATGYDIEIIEAHHRHKVDAPSGTALKMGEPKSANAAKVTQVLERIRNADLDSRRQDESRIRSVSQAGGSNELQTLASALPSSLASLVSVSRLDLKEAQSLVKPDEALIEYFAAGDELFALSLIHI